MFGKKVSYLVVAATLAVAVPLSAQMAKFPLRLATLVPDNSPWSNALRSMDAAVKKATENRVGIQVFPGAAATEQAILSRIKIKGFDAATLTIGGLGSIDKAFNVFGMPFFFESDAELQHVQKQLMPIISAKLGAQRYHLVNWGHGGWVRLFSKTPLRTIAEIKSAKLFTTVGDQDTINWYERNGFHPVGLQPSQIGSSLATGVITATPSPPVYAAPLQIYRTAKYMLDVPLGPLTAATVVSDAAWAQISEADRAKILEVGAATEASLNASAPALDAKYIAEMKKAGLEVVTVDAKALADFKAEAEKLVQSQRGTLVPEDIFDAAVRARDAYRKTRK